MWLVGVVIRRYIDILVIIINFPHSTCIRSFSGSSILTSLFIFKCFSGLLYTTRHRILCDNSGCESDYTNSPTIVAVVTSAYK